MDDAFPGSRLFIENRGGRFEVQWQQRGLLRPLAAAELSDGTLRYLLWTAALLTPRLPKLIVLNEPENSLHPELLPALGRLIVTAARDTQVVVVTHAQRLVEELATARGCTHLRLRKEWGETTLEDSTILQRTPWAWPAR